MIDDLLGKISLTKENFPKRKYTINRLHIFFEGEVTERELLDIIIRSYGQHPEIFEFLELSLIEPPTSNYKTVLKVLDDKEYFNSNQERKVIMESDYIIFLMDLDICVDYRNGDNLDNSNRVLKSIEELENFVYIVSNLVDFKFYFSPSLPSIEYAISIGLEDNIEVYKCTDLSNKNEIFKYFEQLLETPISKRRKSFSELFYSNDVFQTTRMMHNALELRVFHGLPQTVEALKFKFREKNVSDLIQRDKPYTFIDNIHMIIQKIIDSI